MAAMINIKEIRFGNYIKGFDGWGEYVCVSYVIMDQLVCGNTERFSPIPLTPEILVACGFTKYKYPDDSKREMRDMYFIKAGYVQITLAMGETILAGSNNSDTEAQVILNKSTKYLHQLQNLFFALTGDELPIKL